MLPDHILFLDAIPKGSRGKIDYIALGKIAGELDEAALKQASLNHGDQDRSPAVHR
jgi:acyl-coenzyme A synthetase/AMP-(fatty) acid ligase